MIKNIAKNLFGQSISAFNYPLLVNSYGRSGSTVLTNSIISSAISIDNDDLKKIAHRSLSQTAWDLENDDIKSGIVYKTHDYPPERKLPENTRVLYTFADPIDVVLSLINRFDEKGESWMKEHYSHLKVEYSSFDLVNNDQLRLKDHLNAWLNEKKYPIAFIKYEHMWGYQKEISDFLGFNVKFPPFKNRASKDLKDVKMLKLLKKTYGSLIDEIMQLEEFQINNKN